jgi:hypothetical protein
MKVGRIAQQASTGDGLPAAREHGRKGGRPPLVEDDPRVQTAKKLHADQDTANANNRANGTSARTTPKLRLPGIAHIA